VSARCVATDASPLSGMAEALPPSALTLNTAVIASAAMFR
jgi:hypothetical protein